MRASWHLSPSVGVRACECVRFGVSGGGELWLLRRPLSRFSRLYEAACDPKTSPGAGPGPGSDSGLSQNYQPSSGGGQTSAGMTGGGATLLGEERSARNAQRSRLVIDRRRRRAGEG